MALRNGVALATRPNEKVWVGTRVFDCLLITAKTWGGFVKGKIQIAPSTATN